MHAEAQRRLGHALQAISAIQAYIGSDPLQERLADELTRSANWASCRKHCEWPC